MKWRPTTATRKVAFGGQPSADEGAPVGDARLGPSAAAYRLAHLFDELSPGRAAGRGCSP